MRWVAVLGLLAWQGMACAEHAEIALRVARLDPATGATTGEVRSGPDEEPPAGGVKGRPQFKAKAGEPLQLQFIYVNTYPHDVHKDVRIRYYVVHTEKICQKKAPALDKGVVTRGEFQLDFRPKSRVGARTAFTVRAAGVYLLRVESARTKSDHEHFSAIDLVVE
jgi:hypothetical protein